MNDIPEKIGKYPIRSLLGSGAMGIVYLGFDPDIQRTVAIKVLHSHLQKDGQGKSFIDRFRREAQVAAKCSHPNIVSVFEMGRDGDRDFIVMEYVQGEELQYFLKSGNQFSLPESLHIITQVLEGLKIAHKFDIVHRDIKPSNIILLDTGEIKIADFGIAKTETSDLTIAGNVIGTPSYMCPEGLAGEKVDHRADIYSTGMVLLEMLTGEIPTPRELYSQPVSKFLDQVLEHERGQRLPPGVIGILRRALADDKAHRYPDAASFLDAVVEEQAEISMVESAAVSLAETVIQHRPLRKPVPQATTQSVIDQDFLEKLEKGLTSYIGPMASILIKKGSTSNQSPEALINDLATYIDNLQEREEFLALAKRCLKYGTCTGSQTSASSPGAVAGRTSLAEILSANQIQSITRILTFYVGPLAGRILEREVPRHYRLADLHHTLASNIPDNDEQKEFLEKVTQIMR